MDFLKKNHKSNLLYKFAFAMCQTNPVTGEPVFPMDRMPFGWVEYQIEFFSCTNVNQNYIEMLGIVWHETSKKISRAH